MRRLLPAGAPIDLAEAYAGLDPPAEWVALGMVGSVDGAVVVDGRSGALGATGDLAAFRALRSLADVVVVGRGTAAAEHYRATWVARGVEARRRRGQPPLPRLAVVTGSGRVDPGLRALDDPDRPPLVLSTPEGAEVARDRVAGRAQVMEVAAGDDGSVDAVALVDALTRRGLGRVVCEGGPTLNHALLRAGVVDELFLTIAPIVVGGAGSLAGAALSDGPRRLVLHELRVHGSELVCRYRLVTRDGR